MQKRTLLILLICVLIVVGCVQDNVVPTEVTAVFTPTATSTPMPPTATPQPTMTETAVSPTATGITILTRTLTPIPSKTPAPTATPTSQYPEVNLLPAQTYRLRTPSPEDFIQVYAYANDYANRNSSHSPYEYNAQLKIQDSRSLLHVMTSFYYKYYPDGFPNTQELMLEEIVSSDGWNYAPRVVEEIAVASLLTYLNEYEIVFDNGISMSIPNFVLMPTVIQLDDDQEDEVILKIQSSNYEVNTWILLDKFDTQYVNANKQSLLQTPVLFSYIIDTSHDFTGDGYPEITLIRDWYGGGGSDGFWIDIYNWNGSQLVLLEGIQSLSQLSRGSVDYEIKDIDNDGRSEIQIFWSKYNNWGCGWEYTNIYQWNGLQQNHLIHDGVPPNIPECTVSTALRDRELDIITRVQLLETILNGWTPQSAPTLDYYHYLQLRLAYSYYELGFDSEALNLFENIVSYPEPSNLAKILQRNFAPPHLTTLCSSLYDLSGDLKSPLGTDIDHYVSIGAAGGYPRSNSPIPDAFCDPKRLLQGRISNRFLSGASPEDALSNIGYTTLYSQTINLDIDSEPEWLVIVEEGDLLLILDEENGRWHSRLIEFLPTDGTAPQVSLQDYTGDGYDDLLIQLKPDDSCKNNSFRKNWFGLIDSQQSEYTIYSQYTCDPIDMVLSEIGTFSIASQITPPFWDLLANDFPWDVDVYLGHENGFGTYLDTLTEQIINQTASGNISDILLELLAALPPDDPIADITRPRLLFLLGLHSELVGEEETAVSHYLALIQQAPDSPWSWLAWARLEPVE